MSVFREVCETHLLETAEPLKTNGSTCLCYKVKIYDRWQFVKRLRPELEGNSRYVSLFTKEYMVGSRLSHPNLVRYNEMETSDEGVMMMLDYVEGNTLTKILEERPSYFASAKNLTRFCKQLLSCLEYLHSQQVLHLDLKPDNIMITRVNEDVKLLDLGFCRTDCFSESEGKTQGFDAPEQGDNQETRVDVRTDIYAFGRILQEIETHLPGKSLPKKYKQLMKRCLEENPDKRPQHVADCSEYLFRNRRNWRIIISVLLVGMVCMSTLYEPWREEIVYATRNFRFSDYQWEEDYNRLHILSEEEMTCKIVGHAEYHAEQPNMMIIERSGFAGREYRITEIGDSAFVNDTVMQTVFIPNNIRKIGKNAFKGCENLQVLNLPNSVEELGSESFYACYSIRSVHLSNRLTIIPSRCFVDNWGLQSIDIPEGVTQIQDDAFVQCRNLKEVRLPASLQILERGVFYLCHSLQQITLPAHVERIGEYCFYGCENLTDIYCLAPIPPQTLSAFNRNDIRLHVPEGSIEAYRKDPEWGKLEIVEN